ncbi:hypothetical protein BYT27DRAFT_7337378 [Phlegmacium glaucopus]|nr:hypothetical protein BYT27DRAFT_7337378 [Phlegmacium glaucopus]
MADSPPPSPASILKAQLIVENAKLASSKAKKAKKASAILAPTKTMAKKASSKSKKTVNKERMNGGQEEGQESDKENADSSDGINWLKNPDDTSRLILLIEESIRYHKAFGFKGGDVPGVTSGGYTTAQISRDIGDKLFPHSSLPSDKIGKAISNHIRTLKTQYAAYHKSLGQTGHGLVIEDRTAEISSGTPICNVWDKMCVKFPWYKRMHALLHGSPVYNTSALANSATPLDTSVLTTQTTSNRQHSPDWDDATIDASFADHNCTEQDETLSLLLETQSTTPLSSCLKLLEPDSVPDTLFTVPPVSKSSSSSSFEIPGSATQKRKDPFEQVRELMATYTQSRMESECFRAESKCQRLENELNIQQLKNKAQVCQHQHDAEEREHQRQHELQMIEKQITLAQLHAGNANVGNTNMAYSQSGLGYNNYSQGF